jgi:hypothetical protein
MRTKQKKKLLALLSINSDSSDDDSSLWSYSSTINSRAMPPLMDSDSTLRTKDWSMVSSLAIVLLTPPRTWSLLQTLRTKDWSMVSSHAIVLLTPPQTWSLLQTLRTKDWSMVSSRAIALLTSRPLTPPLTKSIPRFCTLDTVSRSQMQFWTPLTTPTCA